MLNTIPRQVRDRMQYLEQIDTQDRTDGTPRLKRLRQIPPEVGRFLALLAASAPRGTFLEIGTSAGYSTLWLALACREVGARIVTFEVLREKATLTRETFDEAEVWDVVELVEGDARKHLDAYRNVSFCFLDAEKEYYLECYDAVTPNLVAGGLLVADNVISHRSGLEPFIRKALHDPLFDALIVPIGQGELVSRRVGRSGGEEA